MNKGSLANMRGEPLLLFGIMCVYGKQELRGLEPPCVAASLAEGLRGASRGKASPYCLGALGGEYLLYGCFKYIAKGYDAVAVKTARNNTAVGEYTEMVRKTVAEYVRVCFLKAYIWPLKALSVLKVELMPYPRASRAPFPLARQPLRKDL